MNRVVLSGVLAATVCLAACSAYRTAPTPAPQRVTVDGRTYLLAPLTAATWTATALGGSADTLQQEHQRALVQAIEKASGCTVTDSNFADSGQQLDAQIACPDITPD